MTTPLDPAFHGLATALAGEFAIESELGRGGMGVVFRARDVMLDRVVALKVLPPRLADDGEVRARFLREARIAAQLSHPNIVPVHRADERGGFAFFAMQLVDGETLGARVRDRGRIPVPEAVRHLREVAWALAYAHARGVIHRDVKPENILIERGTGRAMVTDFGIARHTAAAGLTAEGHVVGTAHYMSPEQARGETVDGRSDLYALGVLGYLLLSGRLPFEGDNGPSVLVAHLTQVARPLAAVASDIPAPIAAVVDRCLAKDPAQRFENGEALADALQSALVAAEAWAAPTVSGPQRTLTEDAAQAVWKRAAQLQAEAGERLEREASAAAARATAQDAAADNQSLSRTYRLRDVESAAVEAGISQRFVALALSELSLQPSAPALAPRVSQRLERIGDAMLGGLQHSLSVSRVIRAPARDVLRAIGRTCQDVPYRMQLRDQLGPHPLDGGIIVFKVPAMDWSGQVSYPFNWLVYGLGAEELRLTLRAVDAQTTEVTVVTDLRPGFSANVWGYGFLNGAAVMGGGIVGAVAAALALPVAGAFLAIPGLVAGMATWGLGLSASRAFYRWEGRTANKELDDLLQAVEARLRTRNLFEEDPPALPPPRRGDDSGLSLIG